MAQYRKKPTPYMDGLRFATGDSRTADPDQTILSDEEIKAAGSTWIALVT